MRYTEGGCERGAEQKNRRDELRLGAPAPPEWRPLAPTRAGPPRAGHQIHICSQNQRASENQGLVPQSAATGDTPAVSGRGGRAGAGATQRQHSGTFACKQGGKNPAIRQSPVIAPSHMSCRQALAGPTIQASLSQLHPNRSPLGRRRWRCGGWRPRRCRPRSQLFTYAGVDGGKRDRAGDWCHVALADGLSHRKAHSHCCPRAGTAAHPRALLGLHSSQACLSDLHCSGCKHRQPHLCPAGSSRRRRRRPCPLLRVHPRHESCSSLLST